MFTRLMTGLVGLVMAGSANAAVVETQDFEDMVAASAAGWFALIPSDS